MRHAQVILKALQVMVDAYLQTENVCVKGMLLFGEPANVLQQC